MKKIEIVFPDCWEELTQPEWEYLLKLRYKLETSSGLTLEDIKRAWSQFALKKRGWNHGFTSVDSLIVVDNAAKSLDWMWKVHENNVVELTFDSTQQLLPTVGRYRGPKSHGADMTFGEFRQAMVMMNAYTQHRNPYLLTALCGILYRQPGNKKKGQYREPFNPDLMSFYSSRIAFMKPWLQWGVYAWFACFCKFLTEGTFVIDGHEVCFAPIFGKNKSSDEVDESLGLNSILFSVAESGVFGNLAETDNALLLRVLMKLLDDHNKAKAIQREIKK